VPLDPDGRQRDRAGRAAKTADGALIRRHPKAGRQATAAAAALASTVWQAIPA